MLIGIPPPQGFVLGNLFLSTITTFKPFFARKIEAVEPAGPAPTTTTSHFNINQQYLIIFSIFQYFLILKFIKSFNSSISLVLFL